jgi:hypothetical protein
MSKGRKSRKNNSYSVKTREKVAEYLVDSSGGGVSSGTSETVETCWNFELINPTPNVKTVKQQDVVKGSIIQDKKLVLIQFDSKPLGYAPSDKSLKIIEASKLKTGYLSGAVTSKTADDQNASIRLCLS